MSTRTPIVSQTLTSGTTSVTFSSIPQTFSDLILVCNVKGTNTTDSLEMTVNNDTGNNYSVVRMTGTTSAGSSAYSSQSSYKIGDYTPNSGSFFAPAIVHINRYANSTIYKTILSRNGIATDWVANIAGLWRNTAAISTITIKLGAGTNIQSGSTFDLYGIVTGGAYATGGNTVTTDGTYWYHAFTSSGTFTPTQAIVADILVVAGGGAGWGGGGGAGGLLAFTSQALISQNYTVTVGAGGSGSGGGSVNSGTNGANSQFGSLTTVIGGGKSGDDYVTNGGQNGKNGGSGGGGGRQSGAGGTATSGQGNNGGTADANASSAGGGGAVAVGGNSSGSQAGAGGNGSSTYSSWGSATSTGENVSGTYYFAGGGGGFGASGTLYGAGGLGGGGRGSTNAGGSVSGTANTGGGGGAAAGGGTGAGGSGIVIVRYPV